MGTAPFTKRCRVVQNLGLSLTRRAAVMRCREMVAERPQLVGVIIMERTRQLPSMPMVSLVPSRFNVRRQSVGQVEGLAALNEGQGQLHDLAVTVQVKVALVAAAASRLAGTRWLPEPLCRSPD